MVGHGGSSAGSYLADPTSPIPSHCASIVATSTLRVKRNLDRGLPSGVGVVNVHVFPYVPNHKILQPCGHQTDCMWIFYVELIDLQIARRARCQS